MSTTRRKPTPKIVSQVCSVCGLDWNSHGVDPTVFTCVKLLLDEVRALNARLAYRPITQPFPFRPAPWPYPRPWYTGWDTAWGNQSGPTGRSSLSPKPVARQTSS